MSKSTVIDDSSEPRYWLPSVANVLARPSLRIVYWFWPGTPLNVDVTVSCVAGLFPDPRNSTSRVSNVVVLTVTVRLPYVVPSNDCSPTVSSRIDPSNAARAVAALPPGGTAV